MKENTKKISYRIMKTNEFKDAVFYRIACDCGSPDHDMGLEIEFDEYPMMTLHIYKDLEASTYWGQPNWFQRQWKKIKFSLRLFFTGYIKVQEELLIQDEEHIDSLIQALQEGKEILKKKRETWQTGNTE
jgi:hypothetical protein